MAGDTTRDRIMEAARLIVQDLGYSGLSFRELAKLVGIKSASIHYYFPTKGSLGEAIMRRYIEYYEPYLDGIVGADTDITSAMRLYTDLFRETLLNGNRMCLAGMLSIERSELPADVQEKIIAWNEMNETWIARVLALNKAGEEDDIKRRAKAIFAAVSGAQMVAHARDDVTVYNDVIATYRASGLIP